MKRSLSYIILLIGTFLWCVFLLLPPWMASHDAFSASISHQCYQFYSLICHQYDSRSLHVGGYKLAVCARCTAIYVGFFIGVMIFPFYSSRKISKTVFWLAVAVFPMVIDVLLDVVGVHSSNIFTRLSSGTFFGIIAALLVTPLFLEACSEVLFKRITN